MHTKLGVHLLFCLSLVPAISMGQTTRPASVAAPQVDHEARLGEQVKRELQRIKQLTEGFDQPYPPGHDFSDALNRLARTSPRALSLANFVISMPDFRAMQHTMFFGSQLARRFDLFADRVSAVSGYLEAARAGIINDRIIGSYGDEALAIALQASSSRIMRLEASAASGQAAKATSRFVELVELAHSSRDLQSLMKGSTYHWDLCNALASRFITLEKLHYPEDEDYLRAAQISALRGTLRAGNMDEARAALADSERRLRAGLTAKRNQEMLAQLARLFSSDGDQRTDSVIRTQRCKPRYAAVTRGTDLYSGNPTTFGGEYLGEDCSEN